MTVEELLRQRSTYKALVTKSSCMLSHLISEGDINRIQKHGVMMKAWFHSFDEVSESYLETLTDDTDINDADSYYDAVYDNYMDQLDSLNYAMDNFTVQAPVVVQRTDTNTTLSTISQTTKLPTMDLEPVDGTHSKHQHPEQEVVKSSTQQVQDDQCNKSVQISTHQQIHHVVSKELLPLSTNDCTSTNCDQSLLDLHSAVKPQSQVSVVTVTKEELPNLVDCGIPVINQSSPISLDPPIAQTDLHVQTPTHCAQYSHTRHATMHPASVMPSVAQLSNGRSADHHILTVPPQDQLELKESYIPSQTPRPGRKVKDGTLHITSTPRLVACQILSGVT